MRRYTISVSPVMPMKSSSMVKFAAVASKSSITARTLSLALASLLDRRTVFFTSPADPSFNVSTCQNTGPVSLILSVPFSKLTILSATVAAAASDPLFALDVVDLEDINHTHRAGQASLPAPVAPSCFAIPEGPAARFSSKAARRCEGRVIDDGDGLCARRIRIKHGFIRGIIGQGIFPAVIDRVVGEAGGATKVDQVTRSRLNPTITSAPSAIVRIRLEPVPVTITGQNIARIIGPPQVQPSSSAVGGVSRGKKFTPSRDSWIRPAYGTPCTNVHTFVGSQPFRGRSRPFPIIITFNVKTSMAALHSL